MPVPRLQGGGHDKKVEGRAVGRVDGQEPRPDSTPGRQGAFRRYNPPLSRTARDRATTNVPALQSLEQLSKVIIGLERRILETIGFDFRTRYPQKILAKLCKHLLGRGYTRDFFAVAYDMSIDLYKTFAPLKQTSHTMALALVELTALVAESPAGVEAVRAVDPALFFTDRVSVVETMLDLLDLYTQHQKSTKVGPQFDLQRFIDVKIAINAEVDSGAAVLRRHARWCQACEEAFARR